MSFYDNLEMNYGGSNSKCDDVLELVLMNQTKISIAKVFFAELKNKHNGWSDEWSFTIIDAFMPACICPRMLDRQLFLTQIIRSSRNSRS